MLAGADRPRGDPVNSYQIFRERGRGADPSGSESAPSRGLDFGASAALAPVLNESAAAIERAGPAALFAVGALS